MIKLHEEYIVDDKGKPSAVVLRIREYRKLLEALEDLADSQYIKEHCKEKRIPLDKVVNEL
jgi:hypothetical protein